jgi:membrane protein implicated in regulation of membrane protease activity
MDRSAGTLIIAVGVVVVIVGVLVTTGAFSWFGRLPGDLRLGGGRTRVFVPITSMLIVSVVLSILLTLLTRR